MDAVLRRVRRGIFAGMVAVGLLGPSAAEPPAPEAEDAPVRGAVVSVSGIIDTALVTNVMRRATEAADDGTGLVVFHITSPGGFLSDGMDLSRDIERLARDEVRTVAFVDAEAYSAAAIAAFSCQQIVMTPEASVGACTPYAASPTGQPMEMPPEVRAKMEGTVIERMESLAEKYGYPRALLKAMVKMETSVIEIRHPETDERRYIEEPDIFQFPGWEKAGVVVAADEVLTVGARQARTYGIATHVADHLDDLHNLYPIEGRLVHYAVSWGERIVEWLNNMYLKSLLVLLGLLGIYVEMHTPGFGVPGTIGIVCFGVVFLAAFLAGRPEYLPLIVFALGTVLLAIEVFVTPGFGIMGAGGIVLMLGGVILALPPSFRVPGGTGVDWSALGHAAVMMAGVLVLFAVAAFVLARFLPRVPVLGRIVLATSSIMDGSSRAAAAGVERLVHVGDVGRATTKLRPAGKALFAGRLVDCTTEGDFLDAGQTVEVTEVRGNRVVVAPSAGEAEGA